MSLRVRTPWIYGPKFDMIAIIGPSIFVTLLVLVFGREWVGVEETPPWLFILLVLGIDVAHVYSSLFRTYFDKEEFRRRRTLYLVVPILCWAAGIALYLGFGKWAFWGVVTYAAIYHFVRQQYGFMMLYRRGESPKGWSATIDRLAIYLAPLMPLAYWHTYGRAFRWFEEFELFRIGPKWPFWVILALTGATFLVYIVKEVRESRATGTVNAGKHLLLAATAVAWSTGIILFNGDLTFTLINIVSHGIPYMALVWIYQYRKREKAPAPPSGILRFFQLRYVPIYVAGLLALAYFEEGIWDWFVWKSNPAIFGAWKMDLSAVALGLLIPLLAMPQLTHYVLDAFIWRVNKKPEEVRAVVG